MKVNGNQLNGTPKKSKELISDELTKKAIAKIENLPLKSFNASATWEKISQRLGQVDKRFVTWGLAMAASFSLLVASNISLFEWNRIDQTETIEKLASIEDIDFHSVVTPPRLPESLSANTLKNIEPKEVEIKSTEITINNIPKETTILAVDKNEIQKTEISPLSNPFVTVFAKANFQFDGVNPEIGIDFKIGENYTAIRRDIFKIGVSSQINYTKSETGERKVHPHTFVNLEYSSLNKKTNKGWTTRTGYLLNPDGQLYQDTTIKVSLFRNVNKHVKIGPEVIFTNNMKKSYPSLSLILG